MRYAIIENGTVTNIVKADGPMPGLVMVPDDGHARIGGAWDGLAFGALPAPEPEPPTLQETLDALTTAVLTGNKTSLTAVKNKGDAAKAAKK